MSDIGTIEITLRADGRVDMRSISMGRPDVLGYAPFEQCRLPLEVEKLARELREQVVLDLRNQAAVHEAALLPSLS